MDSLVNMETGEIDWVAIKKMYKDATLETCTKKFNCKRCNILFYSKNYDKHN